MLMLDARVLYTAVQGRMVHSMQAVQAALCHDRRRDDLEELRHCSMASCS